MKSKKNQNFFNRVETYLSSTSKTVIGSTIVLSLGILAILAFNNTPVTDSTVMLTSLRGGGGSGVVLSSSKFESKILTNGHVCDALKSGGLARTTSGQTHAVAFYQKSLLHDLCLVNVKANLKASTKLSSRSPRIYEKATVSGHPNLLPNVVSSGHFSGNKIIDVLIGFKKCSNEDTKNKKSRLFCQFFGVLPVVRTYETVLVTATIMPGSSGSGIYNSDMELSSLVFAGNGSMGYAFSVPYEYIGTFLSKELSSTVKVYPNYTSSPVSKGPKSRATLKLLNRIDKSCSKTNDLRVKKICTIIERDINWRKNENSIIFNTDIRTDISN